METKPLTPSQTIISDGQIDKAADIFRAQLRKHRREVLSEVAQLVLGQSKLGPELFAVFRQRVEAISKMIVRHAKVDRTRTPQQVLDTTGRRQYTNQSVVKSMPRGEGNEVDVYFFQVSRWISDDDLEKEYELHGLVPDPYAQAQVNTDDPFFADNHLNCMHWRDADGRWCFAIFDRSLAARQVLVDHHDHVWTDDWWFGGVRK